MDIVEVYDRLKSTRRIEIPSIQAFFPTPDERDYERGYITRYFAQRVKGEQPIYEINGDDYVTFNGNIYYKVTSVNWRITGSLTEVREDGMVIDMGVEASNRKSILLERDVMPDLRYYLSNLTQFHKK